MFIKGSPYKTTHITIVWAHTTTVGLIDLKTLLKHTIQSNVYQEFSLTQTTTV